MVLVILVTVFFLGSFLLGRVGEALMEMAEPLAELPLIGGGEENAAVWKSKERVTILLLGTDQRLDEKGPSRTDTMMLLTVDPLNKTGGMLGIPRDLWVRIPLEGGRWVEGKANTAHFYGDLNKYPGGGPALAKKTMETVLGIRVNYVARVNFAPFEKMIDALDGVYVDVEKPLKDDEYPTEDYGTKRVFIPTGLQHLNGQRALEYVRSRHQDSDFGRMKRQQQVLLAVRERALSLGIIPKLPRLIGDFKDMIYTDLAPAEALALAKLVSDVDPESVTTRAIDTCCVAPILTVQGEEALMPNQTAIKKLVGEVFALNQAPQETPARP
ncbi:MAG TPA: LCP family protein [Dehalococcoidia bacterium]|nr:LCP family protein [Dehalococcoidia bacterium]